MQGSTMSQGGPSFSSARLDGPCERKARPRAGPALDYLSILLDNLAVMTVGRLGALKVAPPTASSDLTPVVGSNLRRLRTKRGLSLERLSRASGVSRAMLSQIELGRSTPTIKVLWKIARALGVPFSALITDPTDVQPMVLRAGTAKLLTSHDRSFVSRALFRLDVAKVV